MDDRTRSLLAQLAFMAGTAIVILLLAFLNAREYLSEDATTGIVVVLTIGLGAVGVIRKQRALGTGGLVTAKRALVATAVVATGAAVYVLEQRTPLLDRASVILEVPLVAGFLWHLVWWNRTKARWGRTLLHLPTRGWVRWNAVGLLILLPIVLWGETEGFGAWRPLAMLVIWLGLAEFAVDTWMGVHVRERGILRFLVAIPWTDTVSYAIEGRDRPGKAPVARLVLRLRKRPPLSALLVDPVHYLDGGYGFDLPRPEVVPELESILATRVGGISPPESPGTPGTGSASPDPASPGS